MEIDEFVKSLEEKELQDFLDSTSSQIKATTKVHKVINDTSWIEMIEDSIPYIDNIIRNPRRFIMQEENILPIEKTKFVTEESIKHLAQNTGLIQDVDEDGMVIPLKLLNVYREETVDLYENRFIKSLVDNLYTFVSDKLKGKMEKSSIKATSNVTYDATCKNKESLVKISLKLESENNEEIEEINKKEHSLEERIEHIKEVIVAFQSSKFIKSLQSCQPVRSPIRKTNVILKEQNFIKALELWEYLENNAIKPMSEVTDEEFDCSNDLKKTYDFTFFIQKEALKLNKSSKYDKVKMIKDLDLNVLLSNLITDNNLEEREINALVRKEIRSIYATKRKEEMAINKVFSDFVRDFEGKKNRAIEILK